MRITNLYQYNRTVANYQKSMKSIEESREQLSSGQKISNSYEDASVYNDGLRLDYEISTLKQVSEVTSKAQNFSKNSDNALEEFSKQLENFKVKLVQAASDVHSHTSLEAIANDLEGIYDHLKNIANSSVNGQYLFSGSAVSTKPISDYGVYMGNKDQMSVVGGSNVQIPYNVSGFDIFLGTDSDYAKTLTTNVKLADLSKKNAKEAPVYLDDESSIKNLVGLNYVKDTDSLDGDYDFSETSGVKFQNTYFYLQGTRADGKSFTSKFSMTADASMRALMDKIGMEFGNTATSKIVDVNINDSGQITVEDLTLGNQVINFSLVGATEQVNSKADIANAIAHDAAGTSPASVSKLSDLAGKSDVYITDFTKSKFNDIDGNVVDSLDFDQVKFQRVDNTLISNVSQVNRKTGEFATDSTRLSETAGGDKLYTGSTSKYDIDNQSLGIKVVSKIGTTYDIKINFGTDDGATPTSFEISGVKYPIYNSDEFGDYRTRTSDLTYRQIMDIVAMAASDNIPTLPHDEDAGTLTDEERKENVEVYSASIKKSRGMVEVGFDTKGRITLTDKTQAETTMELAIFDTTESGKFYGDSTGTTDATSQGKGAIFSFMQNNALTIDEPSVDLFKDLQEMIAAVRNGGEQRADSESEDPRNTGLQGGIEKIDHLLDHINKSKVKIGSYTNLLEDTKTRADLMSVNVSSVKSEIIDTDYAFAYLTLMQRTTSFQAMLSSTAKINQLSLLNYL
ncbi:MAG: flagellin biosynthesis protein FlgL [Campylobacter sp.]|nr:flagellin biosynthesis protein FlgL [Campylobacter sp.]